MNIAETIERETGARLAYDAETGRIDVEGTTEEQIARAENLLRENKVEVMKQLRARQGLSPVKTIHRSVQLDWSRDVEVARS